MLSLVDPDRVDPPVSGGDPVATLVVLSALGAVVAVVLWWSERRAARRRAVVERPVAEEVVLGLDDLTRVAGLLVLVRLLSAQDGSAQDGSAQDGSAQDARSATAQGDAVGDVAEGLAGGPPLDPVVGGGGGQQQ
ncbi:hypothetical protein J2S66_002293 [Saccharothrix longispora]|uniref:Uncharacterized protein n=1 Tax=Saccharothrix longispora TaxID=33920 RepID=A0ABU1PVI7_9PSEU|nr:hypothetical protein [Saccharothrix longispora]